MHEAERNQMRSGVSKFGGKNSDVDSEWGNSEREKYPGYYVPSQRRVYKNLKDPAKLMKQIMGMIRSGDKYEIRNAKEMLRINPTLATSLDYMYEKTGKYNWITTQFLVDNKVDNIFELEGLHNLIFSNDNYNDSELPPVIKSYKNLDSIVLKKFTGDLPQMILEDKFKYIHLYGCKFNSLSKDILSLPSLRQFILDNTYFKNMDEDETLNLLQMLSKRGVQVNYNNTDL